MRLPHRAEVFSSWHMATIAARSCKEMYVLMTRKVATELPTGVPGASQAFYPTQARTSHKPSEDMLSLSSTS